MADLQFIDCHLHLQDERLRPVLDDVLARARDRGVGQFLCNGTSPEDWQEVLDLAADREGVVPFLGLHPWFVERFAGEWQELLRTKAVGTPCGIGEIGLDRHFVESGYTEQEDVFEAQLELARELNRPAAVHCVKAWDRLEGILRDREVEDDVIMVHSFGGSRKLMYRLLDLGVLISFSPTLVQNTREALRDAFCAAPLDRIVLETDSPDLFRQPLLTAADREAGLCPEKLNEPGIIPRLYERAAALRGMTAEQLAATVRANADVLMPSVP